MTVTAKTTRVQYTGTGLVKTYAYNWKILDEADLVLVRTVASVDTTLVLNTDYAVTGAGADNGGNVVLSSNLASGALLTVYLDMDIEQPTDLTNQQSPFLERIEAAMDRQALISQQLAEELSRAIRLNPTSTDSAADLSVLLESIDENAAAAQAAKEAAEDAQAATEATRGSIVADAEAAAAAAASPYVTAASDSATNAAASAAAATRQAGLANTARIAAELAETNAEAAAASIPTFEAFGLTLAGTTTASNARAELGLGSAALLDAGTDPGNLLQLNASGQIPAVPGNLITGLTASQISGLSSGMPTGAVVAVASSTVPSGFLECNGAAVSRTTYADLFAAIGVVHGYGNNSTTFNLPDYRGRFLRGWDHAIARDPDRASRTAMNTGGVTGDNVGSVQTDAFKSHTHGFPVASDANSGGYPYAINTAPTNLTSGATGGNETRPINANVMYCIKY